MFQPHHALASSKLTTRAFLPMVLLPFSRLFTTLFTKVFCSPDYWCYTLPYESLTITWNSTQNRSRADHHLDTNAPRSALYEQLPVESQILWPLRKGRQGCVLSRLTRQAKHDGEKI